MRNSKERGAAFSAAAFCAAVAVAVAIAAAVHIFTASGIEKNADAAVRASIGLVFDGDFEYEDVTDRCPAEGVESVYRVERGNGGEDSYCVISKAKAYGGDLRLMTGFTCDGVITSVKVLSAGVESPDFGRGAEDKKFLASFGGTPADGEGVEVDAVPGYAADSEAAVRAVNNACAAVRTLLGLNGEVSEQ